MRPKNLESLHPGAQQLSARWARAERAMRKEDGAWLRGLAAMAKKHSSEAFYALDDPLEAAVFSALIELLKTDLHGTKRGRVSRFL